MVTTQQLTLCASSKKANNHHHFSSKCLCEQSFSSRKGQEVNSFFVGNLTSICWQKLRSSFNDDGFFPGEGHDHLTEMKLKFSYKSSAFSHIKKVVGEIQDLKKWQFLRIETLKKVPNFSLLIFFLSMTIKGISPIFNGGGLNTKLVTG